MNAKEIKKELLRIKNDTHNWEPKFTKEDYEPIDLGNGKFIDVSTNEDNNYMMNYLGSYMSLDPCGKFHHFLSPNGVTKRCEKYWENMEKSASELNMWIESGEGDGCDVFLCKQIENSDL